MRIIALQSGSNGNCVYVEAGEVKLLIDAGISGQKFEERPALQQLLQDAQVFDAMMAIHARAPYLLNRALLPLLQAQLAGGGAADIIQISDFVATVGSEKHQAYAASDFILMPSMFEPCGPPQMIAPIYGSLPVAHDTGGIHDTVSHLDIKRERGNGLLFKFYDSAGFLKS